MQRSAYQEQTGKDVSSCALKLHVAVMVQQNVAMPGRACTSRNRSYRGQRRMLGKKSLEALADGAFVDGFASVETVEDFVDYLFGLIAFAMQ